MVVIDERLEISVSHVKQYLGGLNPHFHNAVVPYGKTAIEKGPQDIPIFG